MLYVVDVHQLIGMSRWDLGGFERSVCVGKNRQTLPTFFRETCSVDGLADISANCLHRDDQCTLQHYKHKFGSCER